MIELFKDAALTTKVEQVTRLVGNGTASSFISPVAVWKLCIDDMKEVSYTNEAGKLYLNSPPSLGANIICVPENAVNLSIHNQDGFKEYTNTVYFSQTVENVYNLKFKLEHDYPEITEASLKLLGPTFTTTVSHTETALSSWPLHIRLVVPVNADIRLFSDIQLCGIKIWNTVNTTYLAINEDGEVDMTVNTIGATEKRRVVIHEL